MLSETTQLTVYREFMKAISDLRNTQTKAIALAKEVETTRERIEALWERVSPVITYKE